MEFARALRRLRESAGSPPYRTMAKVALFSPSVLSGAASGYRVPTLPVTLGFVRACGGDRHEWERRWRQLRMQLALHAPPRPPVEASTAGSVAGSPHALDVPPAQLPIGPHDVVGRRAEFSIAHEAVSVVSDTRVPLVVSGSLGVGKTVFAVCFARRIADDFPDGQLFADLGGDAGNGSSPHQVMGGFLAALGVAPDRIPTDHRQRTGLYRSVLARRRVIVVLDNVRDESQIRPLLARSSRSQILVTSRSRLLGLDGVRRITLNVLPRGESMELIGALIGGDRMYAEPQVCFRLAEFCDDLPLAITIAGRKIATGPDRPISRIVGPLVGDDYALRWLQVGDTGLADALYSAYRSLSALPLQVFHRLGRGGLDELTAGTVALAMKISDDAAEVALERLVDHGLLRRSATTARYVMSTIVERFSRHRAAAESHRYLISTLTCTAHRDGEHAAPRSAPTTAAHPPAPHPIRTLA